MNQLKDGLICSVCHGGKVLTNSVGKSVLCPQCSGRGYLPNTEEIKEEQGNKKRVLLKGQRKNVAIVYSGSCRSLTQYTGTTKVIGGSITGYIKSIKAVYRVVDQDRVKDNGTQASAEGVIDVPLANPADVDAADLILYDDLTEDWEQTKIDDYIPNVKEWLNKEIEKQFKPVEEVSDPPWQGEQVNGGELGFDWY